MDVFIFVVILMLFAQITCLSAGIKRPLPPVWFWVMHSLIFIAITASIITAFGYEVVGVVGYVGLAIYGIMMYLLHLCMVFFSIERIIIPEKVYDCEIWDSKEKADGSKIFFGQIQEGIFKTDVIIETDGKKTIDHKIKVVYCGKSDDETVRIRKFNVKKNAFEVIEVFLRVEEVNV